ncbi:hypothetical protein K458DRAFT_389146 [Lentithecium fluviatile CBS 122367]|uniref:Uncharacterized protein n=1 Tax=Lentithecium fluviatile CBS 122367 TaxID=1168545 RepID=A0A6G1J095_9PLEO|nr:hypothetical protein K458DRAFT_389146 [Lentithecium fluviatile CBS 122367]
MRYTTITLSLAALVLGAPTSNPAALMIQRFAEIPECTMTPGQTCAGAPRQDVIVQYAKDQTQESKDLFLSAAKGAGSEVHEVMNNFGFTGFIPEAVVSLMKAYGETVGVKVHDNGRTGHTERRGAYAKDSSQPPTLSSRRRRWATLLRAQHYQPVISEVLQQELPKYAGGTLALPSSLSSIMRECMLILASAPLVFAAAVDGTLAQRFLSDESLQREYAVMQERAHIQPSIYIHLLADAHGVAPTADQYLVVRERVLDYLGPTAGEQDHELAWMIDNITAPAVARSASDAGYRKYLWISRRSPHRDATLHRFCSGILQRWTEHAPSDRTIPLEFAPSECGYSINSHIRFAQHRNRKSSNYVMNLTEDICSHMHVSGQFTQLFRMHQFIICLIFRPQQAAIAEIFCSGLLQVWIEDGGGLNAYPAGRSVASASRLSQREWAAHGQWVLENTRLKANLKVQKDRLRRDVEGLDAEQDERWREAMESENENDGDDVNDLDYVPEEELEQQFGQLRMD